MLNLFYGFWVGNALVSIIISGLAALISAIATVKLKKKAQKIVTGVICAFLFIILIFSCVSFWVRLNNTETPDIIGETLLVARQKLYECDLFLDEDAEKIFTDNLGTSDFVVQTQEPERGKIIHKKSVVTVTIKDIMDSTEGNEPPIQNPDKTDTSSISTPTPTSTTPTPDPTPTPESTPIPEPIPISNDNSNSENYTAPGEFQPQEPLATDYPANNPYSDTAFSGNASLGGGTNAGDYQPYEPSVDDYAEQDAISDPIPEPS